MRKAPRIQQPATLVTHGQLPPRFLNSFRTSYCAIPERETTISLAFALLLDHSERDACISSADSPFGDGGPLCAKRNLRGQRRERARARRNHNEMKARDIYIGRVACYCHPLATVVTLDDKKTEQNRSHDMRELRCGFCAFTSTSSPPSSSPFSLSRNRIKPQCH